MLKRIIGLRRCFAWFLVRFELLVDEFIDRKRGTGRLRAGDSTAISHVQRTAQLFTSAQDWCPDMVGTRRFIHDQKVSLELEGKLHTMRNGFFTEFSCVCR